MKWLYAEMGTVDGLPAVRQQFTHMELVFQHKGEFEYLVALDLFVGRGVYYAFGGRSISPVQAARMPSAARSSGPMNLQRYKDLHALTSVALAERIGVSRCAVDNWLCGRQEMSRISKFKVDRVISQKVGT